MGDPENGWDDIEAHNIDRAIREGLELGRAIDRKRRGETILRPVATVAELDAELSDLATIRAHQAENKEIIASKISALKAIGERLDEDAEKKARHHEERIRAFCEANREKVCEPGAKSRKLPSGVVGWRKSKERLVVTDEAAAIEWVMAREFDGPFVRRPAVIVKEAFQEHFAKTGEIPPGCEVRGEGDAFYVKPSPLPGLVGDSTK